MQSSPLHRSSQMQRKTQQVKQKLKTRTSQLTVSEKYPTSPLSSAPSARVSRSAINAVTISSSSADEANKTLTEPGPSSSGPLTSSKSKSKQSFEERKLQGQQSNLEKRKYVLQRDLNLLTVFPPRTRKEYQIHMQNPLLFGQMMMISCNKIQTYIPFFYSI